MKTRLLEALSGAFVVAAWILAAGTIPRLPAHVPTHFRLDGTADAFGSPATLWLLPVVATAIYLVISVAQRLPNRYLNFPVKITDRNREAVYALGREMLPALKFTTVLAVACAEWASFDAAVRGAAGPYFNMLIFVPLALIIGVLAIYTIRMRAV